MRNKLLPLALCFGLALSLGTRAGGEEEEPKEFTAKKDVRIYRFISPWGRLKNGDKPVVSFIFPKGFSTDACGTTGKNKKGEVYCRETDVPFNFTKEVTDPSGRRIILRMYMATGRTEKNIKDPIKESKEWVESQFKNPIVKEKVAEGQLLPAMGIKGYYGTYISSHYPSGSQMERAMAHSAGKCTFFSTYSESPVGENAVPIKVENWMHGDLQEKVQKSFRCEELSDRELKKFK